MLLYEIKVEKRGKLKKNSLLGAKNDFGWTGMHSDYVFVRRYVQFHPISRIEALITAAKRQHLKKEQRQVVHAIYRKSITAQLLATQGFTSGCGRNLCLINSLYY